MFVQQTLHAIVSLRYQGTVVDGEKDGDSSDNEEEVDLNDTQILDDLFASNSSMC